MDGRTVELVAVGYIVSLPVVVYAIVELARIPARLYDFTPYSRQIWIATILAGYACFGFGGVLMVGAWVRSPERRELLDDLAVDQRWDPPAPPPPAARPTPVTAPTRAMRRRERRRRQRWTAVVVTIPVALALAVAATAARFG